MWCSLPHEGKTVAKSFRPDHELGPKWSLFMANYLNLALESIGLKSKYKISYRSIRFIT